MAEGPCFVHFPHPGDEHKPDRNGKIAWNTLSNRHRRKFMQLHGKWVDEDDRPHRGSLCAWGEWEPESECIQSLGHEDRGPHLPNFLWRPYWVPKDNYRGLHNTDPFIFGDRFLYSNCLQQSQRGLRSLAAGSVIAFGSKVKGEQAFALDTVLVVKDSFTYSPLEPRASLEGWVPETFLETTGGPLNEDQKLKDRAIRRKQRELRLYRGATPNDLVEGMHSFVPARPADNGLGFRRPPVVLAGHINPRSHQAPMGANRILEPYELRRIWKSLVGQVRKEGLVLGVQFDMPERRAG